MLSAPPLGMTEYECRSLLLQLGAALGLADPQRLADRHEAVIDGLAMHLVFDAERHADRWVLHVELGAPPEHLWALALERLMRLNLLSGSKTTGVFALAPFGRQLVYAVHLFNPAQRSVAALTQGLSQHLAHARAAVELLHAADADGDAALPTTVLSPKIAA